MLLSFRGDRFPTLYLSHPLRRIFYGHEQDAVTVLMYHSISKTPETVSRPYFQTNTDPTVFRRHMEWLVENGYQAISLTKIDEYMTASTRGVRKAVVITFDDGYKDFREIAFPILKRFKFTATVFVPTGYVGRRLMRRECLAWEDIRELQAEGIEFGSHTVTHPKLHQMSRDAINHEISDSKATLEDKTGRPAVMFSYPFAFPQEDCKFLAGLGDILRDHGYKFGVTTRIGRVTQGQDRLFLKRIPVNTHDDELMLKAKMEGGYDWVFIPQYVFRNCFKFFRRTNTTVRDKDNVKSPTPSA